MNPEGGLFEAILENPDDIAPRLIYADWCDEQGDPRGEFIRIQCELAAYEGPPIKVRHLKQREAELLEEHRRAWNGEVHRRLAQTPLCNNVHGRRGLIRRWEYHRGFVEFVVVEAEAFLEHPEALFQIGPLRRLRILRAETCLEKLMQSPFLERLQTVELNLPNSPIRTAERRISTYSRSVPASIQIVPPQSRPTAQRVNRSHSHNVFGFTSLEDLMPCFIGVGLYLICISLFAALSILLGSVLEIVFFKLNVGHLFW